MSTNHGPPPPSREHPGQDDFFVGYLPTSLGLSRFLRWLVPAMLGTATVIGIGVASAQRDPGTGTWQVGNQATLEGQLLAEPYAMLRMPADASGGTIRTFLLVSSGKFGAKARVRPFDGQAARVAGTILHRDDRWMLELSDADTAIQPLPDGGRLAAHLRDHDHTLTIGRITLRGEIIDPKCYIGAMKPGGGKTHKACAQLCVGGGIPPMFVTRDAHTHETFYLLLTGDGQEANQEVIPYLGDAVEITGQLERRGDLWMLRADAAGIRPL